MQGKKKWLVLRGVLIGLACLAGLVCVRLGVRIWRVEKVIGRFERGPSQAGSDELFGLLHDHVATARQGQRILMLLNRPAISTRAAYAAGRPVTIALERPFRLSLSERYGQREKVWIAGRRPPNGGSRHNPRPRYLVVLGAEQAEPGTHLFQVRCTYSLALPQRSEPTRVGHYFRKLLRMVGLSSLKGGQPVRTYACEFELPVEVTVVDKEEAERVELTSSGRLDDAMWDAFSVGTSGFGFVSRTGPVDLECKSPTVLRYNNLPMDVAFQATLRVSDDRRLVRYTGVPRAFRGRAGGSGTFTLAPWAASIDAAGTYRGTLVLTADPNAGYEDPAIKTIWDGELDFPIAFTVSEK